MIKIGIIQFPGVNCEYETARAVEAVGASASICRWNEDAKLIRMFDGYILPGGFSYEDRVRAGAIAAWEDIVGVLAEQARSGKPILGICNGAQVLVEAGLVAGLDEGRIDLALAPNKGMGRSGYYSNWVFVKVTSPKGRCAATFAIDENMVLPIPIAHGQGRFVCGSDEIAKEIDKRGLIVLRYCRFDGSDPKGFPDDPNGSVGFAAAIANPQGNVVAMMPHPERATWLRQVPMEIDSDWARRRLESCGDWKTLEKGGPGLLIFESLKMYIEANLL